MKITNDWRTKIKGQDILLQQRSVVKEHYFTKKENIGKDTWVTIGYYVTLEGALNRYVNEELKNAIDLEDLRESIKEIRILIKRITDI